MTPINEKNYAQIMKTEVEPLLAEKGKVISFTSSDGKKISYEAYKNENARAAVVILHGFTESAEKFREMSYYFLGESYNVYALDLRDHGNSFRTSERVGVVETDDFGKYSADLDFFIENVVKSENEGKDILIYSHSLGSTVALLYMMKHADVVKKAVLSSPMICGNMGMPVAVAGTVAKLLTALGGKGIPAPGRCKFNPDLAFLESDETSPERFAYYHEKRKTNTLLQTNGPAFGWVKASLDARDEILHSADKICAKLLVIKPQEDKQLLMSYTDKFIEKSGAKALTIENSKHEIFMSKNEELQKYLGEIMSFFAE